MDLELDYSIYGTHRLPLVGLSQWLSATGRPVKKVMEIGCGQMSTRLFLNRRVFPELEQLISLESSKIWAFAIHTLFGGDKRLSLRYTEDEGELVRDALNSAPFDVILVDGATNEGRAKAVPICLGAAGFVVLHDVQEPDLMEATRLAPHCVFSVIESPWTAIMSNNEPPFGYDNGRKG